MRAKEDAKEAAFAEIGKNILITLVEPQSAGNVGSVARALKNTGLSNLALVNPCGYLNNDGYSMACKASPVLFTAKVFSSIQDAVKGSGIVAGATRRMGRTRYPLLTLNEAVPKLLEFAQENRVSILFGREDKGLKNEETALCDVLFEIPTHSGYPSINLAHAVFIVCYSLYSAGCSKAPGIKAAGKDDVEMMYAHMEDTLRKLGYGEKGGEYLLQTILRSFRRLYGRTGLMPKEVNMLRGIFTQIEARAGAKKTEK